MKKYRKFSERGKVLDFSCKNLTLVKIKKKPHSLFLFKKEETSFWYKTLQIISFLEKKSTFPRKLKKKQVSHSVQKTKNDTDFESDSFLKHYDESYNAKSELYHVVSLAKNLETDPNSINMEQIQILKKSSFQKQSTVAS